MPVKPVTSMQHLQLFGARVVVVVVGARVVVVVGTGVVVVVVGAGVVVVVVGQSLAVATLQYEDVHGGSVGGS